jgi:hypothetical protein
LGMKIICYPKSLLNFTKIANIYIRISWNTNKFWKYRDCCIWSFLPLLDESDNYKEITEENKMTNSIFWFTIYS